MPIEPIPDLLRATYSIRKYTDQIYKVVKFKSDCVPIGPGAAENHISHEEKLDSSLSRTRRVVLELALCNPWDWFCTFTISQDKYDRSNLIRWRDSFTQWIRDQRKKGLDIEYVIVPEKHFDGSWHAHGLLRLDESQLVPFSDLRKSGVKVPDKLINDNYFNWVAYQKKFGFCSFGRIRNPVAAAFYVTKYLTKDNSRMVSEVGLHQYYPSQGLNHSCLQGEVFGECSYLDQFCVNKYEFCETGMTKLKDGCDWTFGLDYMDFESLEPETECFESQEVDQYMNFVQTCFDLNQPNDNR